MDRCRQRFPLTDLYTSIQNSLEIIDTSDKAISTINVSKIEQSFQISSEFKLNEGMTLSLKFALLFWTDNGSYMSKSGLKEPGQARAGLLFVFFIILEWRLLVNLYRISMQEETSLAYRKALY